MLHHNLQDWLHLFCRATVATRAVPSLTDRNWAIDLLPVDFAAAALARLASMALAGQPPAVSTYHLDASGFGFGRVGVMQTLIPALEQCVGERFTRDVPYSRWRELLHEAGGAAEAALAVLSPPRSSDEGAALPISSAGRPGLERGAARRLAEATLGGEGRQPAPQWCDGAWGRWGAAVVGGEAS